MVKTRVYESLIIDCIKKMIQIAKDGKFIVKQELNGVTVVVSGNSDAELIFRDQQRAQSGYIKGVVGPFAAAELSAEEIASDAQIEAENERKRQAIWAKYEEKARVQRAKVEAKLVGAAPIELADEEGWQKSKEANSDDYGGAVMSYAERWARLMQLEMANGKNLADVAEATSREADLEGITGFMYGCAVGQLAHCWKHGEELRVWHNIKTQLGNEGDVANASGGVLNPALLTLSGG